MGSALDPALLDLVAGKNPYSSLEVALIQRVFSTPSPGFNARLWVLFGLHVFVGLVSLATTSAHVLGEKRRGRAPWIARVVRRDGGTFLVVNQILVIAVAGVGLAVVSLGGIYTTRTFFIKREASDSIAWRISIWAPAFIVMWLVCCSSLATFLHIIGHRCPPWVFRPLRANYPSFVNPFNIVSQGLGGVISVALLVTMIHGIIDSASLTSIFKTLKATLARASAQWEAGVAQDGLILAEVAGLAKRYFVDLDAYAQAYRILLSFFGFSCVLLILLNISSAAFVLVIHRQVLANKGDLQDTTHSSSRGPQISPQARRASQGIGAEDQVSKAEQRVAALRKVELEHLVMTVGAFIVAVLLLVQTIVTVITLTSDRSWAINEFCTTFVYWVFGFVVAVGSSIQLVIELRHLPPPASRRSTLKLGTMGSGNGFNSHSCSQQVTVDVQVQVELEIDEEKESDWRSKPRRVSYAVDHISGESKSGESRV